MAHALVCEACAKAASVPTSGATVTLTAVDPVERQMSARGQTRQIVGVFSTSYSVHGQPIETYAFWRLIHVGSVLDIKTRPYNAFRVLIAASVNLR